MVVEGIPKVYPPPGGWTRREVAHSRALPTQAAGPGPVALGLVWIGHQAELRGGANGRRRDDPRGDGQRGRPGARGRREARGPPRARGVAPGVLVVRLRP